MARRTRRYRIDAPAALFIGTTFILGLGAFFSQNNLLYVAFGLAIGALLASGAFSGFSLLSVDARRVAPAGAVVGEPVAISYEVRSQTRRPPAIAINVLETPRRDEQGWSRGLTIYPAFTPLIPANQRVVCSATVIPERRGEWRFSAIELTTRFPFGVIRKSVIVKRPGVMLALPHPIAPPESALDEALSRASRRAGARRYTEQGSEPEFYALREYVQGDSMRNVAWRASARRDDLVTRLHAGAARRVIRVALFLDEADPFDEENERAISLAAGVMIKAGRTGCAVGLHVPGLSHDRPPISAGADLAPLMEDLARINVDELDASAQRAWRPQHEDALIVVAATPGVLADAPADAVTIDASYARPAGASAAGGQS